MKVTKARKLNNLLKTLKSVGHLFYFSPFFIHKMKISAVKDKIINYFSSECLYIKPTKFVLN